MSQTSRGGGTAPPSTATALPTPKERRRLREALSLSEEQVAEVMGVTKATVKAWETGRSAPRGRKREAYVKLLRTGPEPSAAPEAPAASAAPASPASPEAGTSAGKPTPAPAGNVRPKAAAKRAARPPKAPARPGERPGPAPEPKAGPGPGAASASASGPEPGAQAPAGPESGAQALTGPESGPPNVSAPEPGSPDVSVPGLTPEEAFDALYAHAAPGLVHQAYLLTGRRALSREAVEHAFHRAWEHWPEVAVDADPVGWVRAAAYEYALSPWHRLRRAHKHPDAPPAEAGRRALLGALLDLPAPYRRTVLLYDGLGLDLPETAAETEASTPAAANRLLYAHTVIGERMPELADAGALRERLGALVAEAPTATLPAARAVRGGSERRARRMTRAVVGATAVLICVTALTAATAPTRYVPEVAPGQTVNGVPVRGGPQKLGEEDVELRDMLRSRPNPGPQRLVPVAG
ncbi:helix-turn-helix domain-containing protein [Streptomyces griseus]|uniref:helix-turn-helix domain-containing protein n=1 Tax=Streptomyces griseus TaxID=1911 RepID=UPI0004CAEA66|nr:helix-turn-helix domain-containing protein [Streptomyces griseus]